MADLPECRSMNFPIYSGMLDRFENKEEIRSYYTAGGLNGLEVIRAGESDQGKIKANMINGVHLFFHTFWMDFWLQDYQRLDEQFDSREQWIEYYGGSDREAYLEPFRKDLDYAEEVGARYVVFHVSESNLRECFSYQYYYTDDQIIEEAANVINQLMDGKNYSFDFLVENLWWGGLTMRKPNLTNRLLDLIHYPKKGIMLDLGHYMNTNSMLNNAKEAVDDLHRMLDHYEWLGYPVTEWIKGVHLQMSLGGEYRRKQEALWENPENRLNFDEIPFYELFSLAYEHTTKIDCHQPFLGEGVKELMERIAPRYVTFEFAQNSKEEYGRWIIEEGELLGYVLPKENSYE